VVGHRQHGAGAAAGLRVVVAGGLLQQMNEITAKSKKCVAVGLAPMEKGAYASQTR
jgi:hypothetical protein